MAIPEETIVYTDSGEVCAEDYAFEIHEYVLNDRPETDQFKMTHGGKKK